MRALENVLAAEGPGQVEAAPELRRSLPADGLSPMLAGD